MCNEPRIRPALEHSPASKDGPSETLKTFRDRIFNAGSRPSRQVALRLAAILDRNIRALRDTAFELALQVTAIFKTVRNPISLPFGGRREKKEREERSECNEVRK